MREEKIEEIITGIYKHYKNKKEYQVLFGGKNSETQEDMVIYKALHDDERVWVRPKRIFFEKIKIDGAEVPRFEFISKIEDDDKKNFEHKYKRALADYQNLLKQTAREKQDLYKFANEQFLHEILPVYDNLKIAVLHSGQNNHDAWLEGIKFVIKQFNDILSANGVEEIKTIGEKFDHNIMEAVGSEAADNEDKDETVAKEIKAGYKLNGKVIVPARVVVFKFKM